MTPNDNLDGRRPLYCEPEEVMQVAVHEGKESGISVGFNSNKDE